MTGECKQGPHVVTTVARVMEKQIMLLEDDRQQPGAVRLSSTSGVASC